MYTLSRIDKTMPHLEGFQYATALNLNMGYYTIRLSPDIKDTKRIVAEFVKFRYNHISMSMCDLVDIFKKNCTRYLVTLRPSKYILMIYLSLAIIDLQNTKKNRE